MKTFLFCVYKANCFGIISFCFSRIAMLTTCSRALFSLMSCGSTLRLASFFFAQTDTNSNALISACHSSGLRGAPCSYLLACVVNLDGEKTPNAQRRTPHTLVLVAQPPSVRNDKVNSVVF